MGQLDDYTRMSGDILGPPGEDKQTWDNLVTTSGPPGDGKWTWDN